jgi:hypothetical protein
MQRHVLAAFLTLTVSIAVQAELLLNFDTNESGSTNNLPVAEQAAGLTVSDLTRGSGLKGSSGHSADAFGNSFGGASCTGVAQAVADDRYITWTVTPNAGQFVNFSNLSMWAFVSERTSADTVFWNPYYSLFADAIGFSAGDMIDQIDTEVQVTSPNTLGPFDIDLSGVTELQGVSSPVEFRLYINNKWARGTVTNNRPNMYENVGIGTDDGMAGASNALYMTGVVVPEPALGLATVMLAALLYRRMR